MTDVGTPQDSPFSILFCLPDEELTQEQIQSLHDRGFGKENQAASVWRAFNAGKIRLAQSLFDNFLAGDDWDDRALPSTLQPGFQNISEAAYSLLVDIMSQALAQTRVSLDRVAAPNALGSPLLAHIHHSRASRLFKVIFGLAKDYDMLDDLPRQEMLSCLEELRQEEPMCSHQEWVEAAIRRLRLMEVAGTSGSLAAPTPKI